MRPKILTTDVATYAIGEWSGKNTSGLDAFGDNILVLPDKASETMGTKGVIFAPQKTQDTMSLASESGVIVHAGEDAFRFSPKTGRPYAGRVPKVGDRVIFERYAGRARVGKDGNIYRLMTDSCVGGIETSGETP